MELQLQMKEMIAKSPPNRIEGEEKKRMGNFTFRKRRNLRAFR